MEEAIKDWLIAERSKGVCICEKTLKKKAIQIYNEVHPEEEPENFERLCTKERNTEFETSETAAATRS